MTSHPKLHCSNRWAKRARSMKERAAFSWPWAMTRSRALQRLDDAADQSAEFSGGTQGLLTAGCSEAAAAVGLQAQQDRGICWCAAMLVIRPP